MALGELARRGGGDDEAGAAPRHRPHANTVCETVPIVASGIHATEVDLGGLLTVLGSHLYSTPAVAVRELVQNAHDSISRRRIEDPAFEGGAIELEGDPASGVLVDRVDGAGETHEVGTRFRGIVCAYPIIA